MKGLGCLAAVILWMALLTTGALGAVGLSLGYRDAVTIWVFVVFLVVFAGAVFRVFQK